MSCHLQLVVTVFASVVLAASAFSDCIGQAAPSVTLRSPSQPDFGFHLSRSLYPSPSPNYIAVVYSASDVQAVLGCAAKTNVRVCPRAGGHSFTGSSSCNGVMIDVRNLNTLNYDTASMTITAGVGNTLGEMFYNVITSSGGSRIIGVGLCPSVGVGGYMLGGGHNPYSGLLGLTCDSLLSMKIVLPDGKLVTATKSENSEIFWASCGGGGGTFGVAIEYTLQTHDAAVFNNNVFFRYSWPRANAGSILSQWMDWNQDGGNTWMRLEINGGGPVYGYGVCWGVSSTAACETRLSQQPFFNSAGRNTNFIYKGTKVAEFQKFIGPAGNWGNKVAEVSDSAALVGQVYLDASNGPRRLYSSSFWKFYPGPKPSVATLQQVAEACGGIDGSKVEWLVCQFNPWKGKVLNPSDPGQNAFAHRGMTAFSEFIGQVNPNADQAAGLAELRRVDATFKSLSRPFRGGTYVSYPEFGLSVSDYSYLYWGQNLQRLAYLRQATDPMKLFAQLQELPSGKIPCPGNLEVTSPQPTVRSLKVSGYTIGQLAGMVVKFSLSSGCTVDATSTRGANIVAEGSNGVYKAEVYSNEPFAITLKSGSPATCMVATREVNGISCS